MKKDVLRYIKNDMWEVLSNKKYLQAEIKGKLKEIEERRKEALAEYKNLPEDDWYRQYAFRTTNEHFDSERVRAIFDLYERWHNNQSYYLIYKDGSCVCITAEDILGGEKFPKVSDVVYAYMMSADDELDTESGDLDFYSDERMEACDWDYSVEDERKEVYEMSIEVRFGTDCGKKYQQRHPEFVPVRP